MKTTLFPLTCALLAATSLCSAQTIHVVDPIGGPFVQIQDAVDAAVSGDVVLVRQGTYTQGMTIDGKGITVVADNLDSPVTTHQRIQNIPAGEQVIVRGLDSSATVSNTLVEIVDCQGVVWLEDLTATSGFSPFGGHTHGLLVQNSDAVHLVDCTFNAGFGGDVFQTNDGLNATASSLWIWNSTFRGRDGGGVTDDDIGGDGAFLVSSDLFAARSSFLGGKGADGADDFLFGCFDGSDGGDGLASVGLSNVVLVDAELVAGEGGAPGSSSCDAGDAGLPFSTDGGGSLTQTAGPVPSFSATSPVRAGQQAVLSYESQPGDLTFMVWSWNVTDLLLLEFAGAGAVGTPFFLSPTTSAVAADGTVDVPISIPATFLPPGRRMIMQGFVLTPQPAALLAGPSAVVILDPGT